jgi:hypothetical protein
MLNSAYHKNLFAGLVRVWGVFLLFALTSAGRVGVV